MAFVVYAIKMYFNDDFNEETAPEKSMQVQVITTQLNTIINGRLKQPIFKHDWTYFSNLLFNLKRKNYFFILLLNTTYKIFYVYAFIVTQLIIHGRE